MRSILSRVVVGVVVLAATLPAGAHVFPSKAKSIKSDLVQNYPPCTAPNATTTGGTPACLETDEVDTSCGFGSKGSGNLSATISGTDIKVKGQLKGLDTTCDGKTLAAAFTVRITTDDCPDEHCTVVDQEITAGTCTVSGGSCKINAALASGFPAGAGSEMTILSCGIKNGSLETFSCGIMVK